MREIIAVCRCGLLTQRVVLNKQVLVICDGAGIYNITQNLCGAVALFVWSELLVVQPVCEQIHEGPIPPPLGDYRPRLLVGLS